MKQNKIKGNQLKKLGLHDPKLISMVLEIFRKSMKYASKNQKVNKLQAVLENLDMYKEDAVFRNFVAEFTNSKVDMTKSLEDPKPFRIYSD